MTSRLKEIGELTRVRVLLFVREPEAIFWVFVFPLVLAAVLGFAFRSRGVEPARIGLLEGPESAALQARLEREEHIVVVRFAERDEARQKLARAALDLLLEGGGNAPLKLSFDPTRPEAETARLRVERALDPEREASAAPALELDPVKETGSRYVDFLFPGLIGMNLMGTGMWGIGFAIADVRRKKFLKRLLVTPMRRSSFFLSFVLARLVFLTMELAVLGLFGTWILGVPLRGSLAAFAAVSLAGALAFAGIGILTASRARTIEAVSGLMNVVMLPMWMLSGIFFSSSRYPEAAQPLIRLLPLTALIDALRAVMIDGSSIFSQVPQVVVLAVWGSVTFIIALKIFRWQ